MAAGTKKFRTDIEIKSSLLMSAQTSSRALELDGSGNLVSSSVTSTELGYLSGVTSAIQTQLDGKLGTFSSTTDNRLVRTDGTSGDAVQESAITVDDTGNMTGVNDLTVTGDLTVNGTTTTVNTATLDVEDPNITVNSGGTQSTANTNKAGFTVDMSDAVNAVIGYSSSATSKFVIGESGSEIEIADISSSQTLQNKTIDGTAATGNNTVTTDADQVTYERADLNKKNIQSTSDDTEAALTDLDDTLGDISALGTPTNYTTADETEVASRLDGIDTALGSTADEKVKVSANDTTAKYLEDAVVAGSTKLSITTLNDGADEDVEFDVVESNIDHDALTNFVANEHIDHSTVNINTAADSGLTGGGDITTSRSLEVDITGTTEETSVADGDEILIEDISASAKRKMSRSNFLGAATPSSGDISETSFSGANNVTTATDVTGFAFANADVRSFNAHVSVFVDAGSDLYEEFELEGIQKGADWFMTIESLGDDSQVSFSITSAGQIQYTSGNYATFVSLTIKFRAITTSV